MGAYVDSLQARVLGQATSKHRIQSKLARQHAGPAGWFESWYVMLLLASIALNAFVLYTIFQVCG